jgi:hypothetical protein
LSNESPPQLLYFATGVPMTSTYYARIARGKKPAELSSAAILETYRFHAVLHRRNKLRPLVARFRPAHRVGNLVA